MKKKLVNARIQRTERIHSPRQFRKLVPISKDGQRVVLETRETMSKIIHGTDKRLAVMVGPCSIHSKEGTIKFAQLLSGHQKKMPNLSIFMRACFEKPRSVIEGPHHWRGLAVDPLGDGTSDVDQGIRLSREIAVEILSLGIPLAGEFLRSDVFNCLADLFSCAWIGARNSGHQGHWEVASGLSMPVGVKHDNNGGGLLTVQNALVSIKQAMAFQAQLDNGCSGMYETTGNSDTFGILRGTSAGPNYTQFHTRNFHQLLSQKGLSGAVCVDLSHGNASHPDGKKDCILQMVSGADVARQVKQGDGHIRALMIEASMKGGKHEKHPRSIAEADPLLSLTDPCLGPRDTIKLLKILDRAAASRFS